MILGSPLWCWIILAFLIVIVGCMVNIHYLKYDIEYKGSEKELLDEVENGDLLFFTGETYGEKAIRWYSGSNFSHICMVFRDNENGSSVSFVWEADVGQRYKEGPRVMRLKEKLERWKGVKICALKKMIGKRPSTLDILKVVERY
jgi:hypothetical protein